MKNKKTQERKKHTLVWILLIVVALLAGAFGLYAQFHLKRPAPVAMSAPVRVKIPPMPAAPVKIPDANQPVSSGTAPSDTAQQTGETGQQTVAAAVGTANQANMPTPEPAAAGTKDRQTAVESGASGDSPPLPNASPMAVGKSDLEKGQPAAPPASDSALGGDPSVDRPAPAPPVETAAAPSALQPAASAQDPPEAAVRYSVQVGAFRTKAYADLAVSQLMEKGYDAYIFQRTDKTQRVWYLVRFGRFQDREAAVEALTAFKNQEHMDASLAISNAI